MTDEEKIEKLLNHICKYEVSMDCDDLFGDDMYADDGEWCERHCKYTEPQKECFSHFLLGEVAE